MSPTTLRKRAEISRLRIDHHQPRQTTEKHRPAVLTKRRFRSSAIILVAVTGAAAALLTREQWTPRAQQVLAAVQERFNAGKDAPEASGDQPVETDAHAGHNHADAGSATSLELSEQAQKNVGLQLMVIKPRDFDRTINVPAMVKERPGRTEIKVSAPMTGIVTRIHPIRGEAVSPGTPLFDLRLTHEDLVNTQSAFLETIEQLDVIKREVARLEKVTLSGAIAGKTLLEREYEQQKTEARLRAQQQALILHGIAKEQVEQIQTKRRLIQQVTVVTPKPIETSEAGSGKRLLQVSKIEVAHGQHVQAGELLCVVSDHAVLYIEGKGFEEDSGELNEAVNAGSPITAVIDANGEGPHIVSDLRILYLENEVELESRALRFYVRLPNELVRNEQTEDGHQFIGWRFKPGQRVELLVPVERWENRIVLPVDAVVKEGAEWFVFQQNGNRFDRKPVHIEYRDQWWAVIESDGTLFPGDVVATSGSYQMHLALKNKAGAGADPHAGHNH